MNWLLVFLSCTIVTVSRAQVSIIKDGPCSGVTGADPMQSFDLAKYAGDWYEISRYEQPNPKGVDCVKGVYTATADPKFVDIVNSATVLSVRQDIHASAKIEQPNPPSGKLIVHFTENEAPTTSDYRVLDTDYVSYAVVFSCKDNTNANKHTESAWILSKTRTLTAAANTSVEQIIKNSPIDRKYLRTTEQDEYICTTPTACDKTLAPVQENFLPGDYLKKWYEISRSEKEFESNGDCVTAEYSAGTKDLVVKNAMTILKNRTVSSIDGTAKLANENGNPLLGLLKVSFTVNGVSTDSEYRVLSTDYNTYSIVYSCKNDNGKVSYGSAWVLSRDRVLSSKTKTTVKEILKNSPISDVVLRTTEQDEYICTTPTACDKTLAPVQENFKAADYLGEWYEYSRYEKEFETNGDCVTAEYSSGTSGGLVVNNTMTVLENRTTISIQGTAKLAYEKGDPLLGLLKVSFNVNGVPTNSEYRVLSTDYKTYSIVYSCKNDKGTPSYGAAWILSRSRDLKNFDEVKKIVDNSQIDFGKMRPTEQDEDKCNGANVSQTTSIFLVLTAVLISFFVKQ